METKSVNSIHKKDLYNLPDGWKLKKLGNLGKVSSGTTPFREKHDEYFANGTIHWVKTTDLNNSTIFFTEEKVTVRALNETSLRIYQPGTLLVAMYGGFNQIGRTGLLGVEATINQALSALQCNIEIALPEYVLAWLNGNVKAWRNFAGSSRKDPNITSKDINDFPVNLPPLPQQRKIAAILSTWDEAIQTADQLLKAKKERKRGLMQQLLTGQKRLPGFAGEWREVLFNDILREVKRPVKWNDDEVYHLLSVRRRSGGVFYRESLPGREILTQNLRTAKTGEFLISKMQIVHGASGLVREEHDGMKISGSYIAVVSQDRELLDIEYFDWYSQLKSFYRLCYTSSYGVHIEKMTFDFTDFLKRKISIPPTIGEQQAIAAVLNAANEEIRLATAEVEALKQQKRGLMQELLTGKTLVNVQNETA